MAKFNRQVGRQKKNFEFTKKEAEKEESLLKKTLSFEWIPRKWSSLLIVLLNFVFVTVLGIPLLMLRFNQEISMLLGHGVITSLLIVMSFYHLENKTKKPKLMELVSRYLVMAILLSAFSILAIKVL